MIPVAVLTPSGAAVAADADKNREHLLVGCLFCIFKECRSAKAGKKILRGTQAAFGRE